MLLSLSSSRLYCSWSRLHLNYTTRYLLRRKTHPHFLCSFHESFVIFGVFALSDSGLDLLFVCVCVRVYVCFFVVINETDMMSLCAEFLSFRLFFLFLIA